MFQFGFWELCIVFVVALLVIGPDRLPASARVLMRWTKQIRELASGVQHEIQRELSTDELMEIAREKQRQIENWYPADTEHDPVQPTSQADAPADSVQESESDSNSDQARPKSAAKKSRGPKTKTAKRS